MTDRDEAQVEEYRISRKAALATGAGLLGTADELHLHGMSAAAEELRARQAAGSSQALNRNALNTAMRAQGTAMKGGVFAFSIGRKDLNVHVERVPILPSFALAFEANFLGLNPGMAMVAGEIPVRETEANAPISTRAAPGPRALRCR